MLLALLWLDNGAVADLFNKGKAHIGNGCGTVKTTLCFHLDNDMLQCFLFILVKLKLLQDQMIPLCQLGGCKTDGYACIFRMILDQVHDSMKAAVNSTAMIISITEVLSAGTFLIFGYMHGVGDQLPDSFIFGSRNGDNRNPKLGFHFVDQNGAAVFSDLIHHVEGKYHRDIQLHQLHGKIQITFDIRCINDVDDTLWVLVQDKIPGNDLLTGIGGHGVNAGKVSHKSVLFSADRSILSVYGYTGEITNMLVGAGKLIEKCCFATVLVASQCKGKQGILRQRIFIIFIMEPSTFTKTGVRHHLFVKGRIRRPGRVNGIPDRIDFYFFCVGKPQGKLIAVDPYFYRITHRCIFYHGDIRFRDNSHVKEMLAQGTLPANRKNRGTFADRQII